MGLQLEADFDDIEGCYDKPMGDVSIGEAEEWEYLTWILDLLSPQR